MSLMEVHCESKQLINQKSLTYCKGLIIGSDSCKRKIFLFKNILF